MKSPNPPARRGARSLLGSSLRFLACWTGIACLAAGVWVHGKFGEPSFEQVVYHLRFGASGLLDADRSLMRQFIVQCLVLPLLLAWALLAYENALHEIRRVGWQAWVAAVRARVADRIARLHACLLAPAARWIGQGSWLAFRLKLPLVLLVVGTVFLLTRLSFWQYATHAQESGFFAEHYVVPHDVKPPASKRNLVLIYVESLETAYSDPSLFGQDLLRGLGEATPQGVSFNRYRQTAGTGWTIAAIVSTQCGVPLKLIGLHDINRQGENVSRFMPGAICLGDVLEGAGYRNVFLGGASHEFAGKGKFLAEHGYSTVYGREEWARAGQSRFNDWGLYDDDLFAMATQKLDELEAAGQPFNLTLLTVDTHHPDGFINRTCRQAGVNDFPGIVSCTADLVAGFVRHAQDRGYLKNTDVVIMGDHLAMPNPVYERLQRQAGGRTIYNRFVSSQPLRKNREDLYHFSMFPTILTMLGFQIPEGRLGLGVAAFGPLTAPDRLQDMTDLDAQLSAPSQRYVKLWADEVNASGLAPQPVATTTARRPTARPGVERTSLPLGRQATAPATGVERRS